MNTKNIFVIVALILIIAGIFFIVEHRAHLSNTTLSTTSNNKILVTASFYPLYYLASIIGGTYADVVNITPAGGEPHDYEPSAQDAARIENSAMLLLVGDSMESWGKKERESLNPQKTLIVMAADTLTTQQVLEDGVNIVDPHVWLSPTLVIQMVDRILAGYEKIDPNHTVYYAHNAEALKARLHGLDIDFKNGLANCKKQDIVTSHAAFGYLASTYHLHQIPIAGLSPDAEPSAQQLAAIVEIVKKDSIQYIFFESLVSPKLAQTIATEVGAQTLLFDPLEGITQTNLEQGKDYFTQMQLNLANLKIALQCN